MKNETVYYLAQVYRADRKKAIEFAHRMATKIRKRGYLVFSPIEYTHYTHEWLLYQRKMVSNKDQHYPIPDYVAEDLRLMTTWLNHDAINVEKFRIRFGKSCLICDFRRSSYGTKDDLVCRSCENLNKFKPINNRFDTGLVIPMDDNAYEIKNGKIYWFSKGCKEEFYWGIKHDVRIISLQNFVIDRLIDLPRDLEEELNR